MNILEQGTNFRSLSIRDLIEARDLYHYHLLNKENVVGTGIGLYLIRDHDDKTTPRTLSNAHVLKESWPCVLVFVRRWLDPRMFSEGGQAKATDMVPKTLYMPDGRTVPVCTVLVEEAVHPDTPSSAPLPHSGLGGGLPLMVQVQGVDREASAGCLVSDGHLTYALTARHACGPAGTKVYGRMRGHSQVVGHSSARQLTRLPFSEVYPDFPGRRSYLALDVGLVEVADVTQWTSNVYGLPPTGLLADLFEQNLTLQLMDHQVVARGAISGLLRGTIKALFYRYRSVGGYDYVGDFLIAPVAESRSPSHGDSGTVWHLDVTTHAGNPVDTPLKDLDLRPLAVLWGGQSFELDGKTFNFTVATALSNVCKLLDVDLLTNCNRGVSGYWGRMGHYSIAAYAVQLVKEPTLKKLLEANLDSLSFDLDTLLQTSSTDLLKGATFVPLADVADEVWKKFKTRPGGRDTVSSGQGRTTGPEHPNHYADIDFPYENGKTLRELCISDSKHYFTPESFSKYYKWLSDTQPELGGSKAQPFKQGLLPFRVWQFFDAMKDFAARADGGQGTASFLAAAGIAAHYLGDACQPLHGSVYADGDPTRKKTFTHPVSGKTEQVSYGAGIHSAYETAMIDRHKADLFPLIDKTVKKPKNGIKTYATGRDAGLSTIELMQATAELLPGISLCDAYEALGGGPSATVAVLDGLWERFDKPTAEVMALGARYLACLWESAWNAGKGNAARHAIGPVQQSSLKKLYEDTNFMKSYELDKIGSVLK
jgi:hypothetical protein